jgi:hypothetical protein
MRKSALEVPCKARANACAATTKDNWLASARGSGGFSVQFAGKIRIAQVRAKR